MVRRGHAGKRGEVHVPMGSVDDVLVYLVGDHESIDLLRQAGDELELGTGEDAAGRIGRIAEDQRLGFLRKGSPQLVRIECEGRGPQRHVDGLGS